MKRIGITIMVILSIALTSFLIVLLFRVDFGKNDKNTDQEIYATDITINTEFRSLTLYVGNTLKFASNPYGVTPSNYNQGVEIKILNYVGEEREGATFQNNSFKASETGTFYLRFIVKTKYNTTKYDGIKISVVDKIDESCKCVILKQDATTISVKETVDISEFVTIYNLGVSNLIYKSSGGRMNGSIFIPDGLGSYNIEIIIDNGDYLIFNYFTVVVNVDDEINIALYDVANNKIGNGEYVKCSLSNEILMFSYIVEGLISQLITIEVKNKEIVSLISSDAPIIIFELANVGETEIIIKIPNKSYEFKFYLKVE